MKTLINRDGNGVQKNVPDVEFFGNADGFQLICKASSQEEGWMKSTKAMEIPGVGCLVQVTTQQQSGINDSYVIAEALTFVPGVQIDCIHELGNEDKLIGRRLISISEVARVGLRGVTRLQGKAVGDDNEEKLDYQPRDIEPVPVDGDPNIFSPVKDWPAWKR